MPRVPETGWGWRAGSRPHLESRDGLTERTKKLRAERGAGPVRGSGSREGTGAVGKVGGERV